MGSEQLRTTLFENSARLEILTVQNRGGWVFADAEHRYTMALVAVTHGAPGGKTIALRGPFASRARFDVGVVSSPHEFSPSEVLAWTSSASLPLLPDEASIDVFLQLRKAPRLDLNDGASWRARPDRELDATNDRNLMKFVEEQPDGFWPVFKGESFDLWECDRGPATYYAWADPKPVLRHLHDKRLNSARRRRDSAHSEFDLKLLRDPQTLACQAPRVVFRDVARATDQRTVRAALIPPQVFVANQAPYFLWPRGDQSDAAFLIGILSSIPLDWYARRYVETHLNFFVINPFPVPRPARTEKFWKRAVALAGRLAAPDKRFASWAKSVGVSHGSLDSDEKRDIVEELDAVAAHLYGLTENQLTHIFKTFHEGWDYENRLEATLRHFRAHAKAAVTA